jgi:hypothetical protein
MLLATCLFQDNKKLSLFQIGLSSRVEKTNIPLERNPHYFPVRMEFVLQGIIPANHSSQDGKRLILFQMDQFN